MDYCQNLDLPHTGENQPGDCYYYSPIWIYLLGLVNAKDDQLYAYTYPESAGKKGGNNTTSIIINYLRTFVFNNDQVSTKKEFNLIMDNCAGQNKNRMIINMASYLVEKIGRVHV